MGPPVGLHWPPRARKKAGKTCWLALGTAASCCQRDDCDLLIPRSERVDAVAPCDRVVPRLVPGSAAPLAFSAAACSSPALRSALRRISQARRSVTARALPATMTVQAAGGGRPDRQGRDLQHLGRGGRRPGDPGLHSRMVRRRRSASCHDRSTLRSNAGRNGTSGARTVAAADRPRRELLAHSCVGQGGGALGNGSRLEPLLPPPVLCCGPRRPTVRFCWASS